LEVRIMMKGIILFDLFRLKSVDLEEQNAFLILMIRKTLLYCKGQA